MAANGRNTAAGGLWRACATLLYTTGMLKVLRRWTNRLEMSRPGGHGFPSVRRHRSGKVQILSYHRVAPEPDEFLPPMPLAVFERQMEFLARACNVLGLEQAIEGLRSGDVPDNAVAVTFDDGYRDNLVHALPVLNALSLPATVFLVTGCIGTGKLIWHDRVVRAFHATPVRELPGFGPDGATSPLTGADNRRRARQSVLRYLKTLDVARREAEIARLTELLEVTDITVREGLMLDWDEVREMRAAGVSVGAHTVSHPILSRIPDEQAREEIEGSKREIERQLGEAVHGFAYPNGARRDFTPAIKRMLAEAGYEYALTTILGANAAPSATTLDLLELKRLNIEEDHVPAFAAKLDLLRLNSAPTR